MFDLPHESPTPQTPLFADWPAVPAEHGDPADLAELDWGALGQLVQQRAAAVRDWPEAQA